jgi:hypothetical protein
MPTATPTPTYTPYPTPTYTPSPSPTATWTPTYTPSPTATSTPTPTMTPTYTPRPTNTPDPCYGATLPGARKKFSFEQIIPCLNTPELVSKFMKNNVKWDGNYDNRVCGGNCYFPAEMVYKNGIDDCDGHAILQAYILEKNGWDAYMIGLAIAGGPPDVCGECPGHNVTGVNLPNGKILVLDNEGLMRGPFNSLAEIAQFYIRLGWMWDGGSLRTIKASAINRPLVIPTKPDLDAANLPWEFHDYPHRPDINPYDY